MILANRDFVIFDFETTGLNPAFGDRPCEFGAARYEYDNGLNEVETMQHIVDPQCSIDKEIEEIHGISEETARSHKPFQAIADDVDAFIGDSILVAHNASFDINFLCAEYDIVGIDYPENPIIDTLKLARNIKTFPNNSLEEIAESLNLDNQPTHRSISDVRATADFLAYAINHFDPDNINDLINYQDKMVTPPDRPDFTVPEPIATSLENSVDITVDYTSSNNNTTTRTISPLRISKNNNKQYVIAYDHDKDSVRTFRLDRFDNLYD